MLTYADRLAAMRETKIRHTIEKKAQDGYRDLDDFGTVPLPKGYAVEPYYNSENGSFYGLRARGGVTVDASWQDGRATSCTLTAERDTTVKLRVGETIHTLSLTKNQPTTLTF